MDYWQSLIERFLRNECTERENKFIYLALRDGWIDDRFRAALDDFLAADGVEETPESRKASDEPQLEIVPASIPKRRSLFSRWISIAAVIALTFAATWTVFQYSSPDAGMNTVSVPAGQTTRIELADGSVIWLNARSTLRYPARFDRKRREVFLKGEGFFEVAANKEKPFVVQAGGYSVTALGTSFNVESYETDSLFSTSLLRGSVEVTSAHHEQSIMLSPNEKAQIRNGQLVRTAITDTDHYRWREGLICFNNIHFSDLMTQFEKCYGIRIIIEKSGIDKHRCTGKFRQVDGIDYALRVLQRNVPFKYTRDEDRHIIYIR